MKTIKEAKQFSSELVRLGTERKAIQDRMDQMIRMDWIEKPSLEKNPNLKLTVSPQARNTFLGAKRLMTATNPIIRIPRGKNDDSMKDKFDPMENFCKAVWDLSGKFAGKPVHFDLVDQLLRYDEFQIGITDTQDLLKIHEKGSKAEKYRYQRIAETTPYIFSILDAKSGYWEADSFGVINYLQVKKLTNVAAFSMFGEEAMKAAGLDTANSVMPVFYHDYWDLDVHFAWLSNSAEGYQNNDALLVGGGEGMGKHDLPVIPIICQVGEASQHEGDVNYMRQPLLYGVDKANLWQRLNMLHTYQFTAIHNISMNPMWIHTRGLENPDTDVEMDFSNPSGIVHLPPGDNIQPMMRDAVNMDMQKGLQEARQLWDESSIYPQTFGQPLGGQQAFSTVALLSQSGRLPLVTYQLTGGFGISRAFEAMFALMRASTKPRSAQWLNKAIEIEPEDIPINLLIEVRLDADLPTDRLKQATMAMQLKQADLVSKDWIRDEVLGINDSADMEEDRFAELFDDKMMNELLGGKMREQITMELQQKMQQQAAQQYQNQAPQGGSPEGGTPEGGAPAEQPWQDRKPWQSQPARPPMRGKGQDSYGGLPPSALGMIEAERPGEKPFPAAFSQGGIQRGE